ncbi:MAG: hypothetical protein NT169_15960 [Chloroflexi bacterium]|nr:hypothetical protein [Chloroflexota bacterium]
MRRNAERRLPPACDYSKLEYEEIQEVLLESQELIAGDASVENAWKLLRARLSWTDVMISKSLHFMARSLGFEANPPVPIDNKVILNQIWPAFKNKVKMESRTQGDTFIPGEWRDSSYSWDAYNRYMTAINKWATAKGWTTTQVESTLFGTFAMDVS